MVQTGPENDLQSYYINYIPHMLYINKTVIKWFWIKLPNGSKIPKYNVFLPFNNEIYILAAYQ